MFIVYYIPKPTLAWSGSYSTTPIVFMAPQGLLHVVLRGVEAITVIQHLNVVE